MFGSKEANMKIIKYLCVSFLFLILLFLLVSRYSSVETKYECSGVMTPQTGNSQPKTVFIKIENARWWVGLWSDSDASVFLEIPNEAVDYYGHAVEVGDQLQIYDLNEVYKGNFSVLSKTLGLSTFFRILRRKM
jgi:hypothetical protein